MKRQVHFEEAARTKEIPPESIGIFQTLTLPSGTRMRNRLVKVAMYEHLAAFGGGPPNTHHLNLYLEWAKHRWGMIITGNVIVTDDHLTLGRDVILPKSLEVDTESAMLAFKQWADAIHGIGSVADNLPVLPNKTLAIMQLSHAGRQSTNFLGGRIPFQPPLAPSAIRVAPSNLSRISRIVNALMFQTPRAMLQTDIHRVIDRFVEGAVLAYRTGFDGVQLHAAHGYLLAQFLSPKSNKREDIYSTDHALDILWTITTYIRENTSSTFVIGIKLNAAEYISGTAIGNMEQHALKHVLCMATWGLLDFIEISGGDYESPEFMGHGAPRSQRQAFFAGFSHKALQALEPLRSMITTPLPLILLTGGLKSIKLLNSALICRHSDLLGIGRASVPHPDLPSVILERYQNKALEDQCFSPEPKFENGVLTSLFGVWSILAKIKIIGAGSEMAWYIVAMRQVARNKGTPTYLAYGQLRAILCMWVWTPSSHAWTRIFNRRAFYIFAILISILTYLIRIVCY